MSIIHAETLAETVVPPPMKDIEIIVLIEDLLQMQEKANGLAVQQLELMKQLETALKKSRELHQTILGEKRDVGGEG
jgi:hypothetical protein